MHPSFLLVFPGVGTRCRKRTTPLLSEETRYVVEAAAVSLHSPPRRAAAPNIPPKAYIEGRRETRNGRERMGAVPFLPHTLSTLWSCCCRYLSASMPATHNLFFPQSDANSRKCMSAVDYDGRPPASDNHDSVPVVVRCAVPQPKGQNGLAVGRQFMEAVKQLDGRARRTRQTNDRSGRRRRMK